MTETLALKPKWMDAIMSRVRLESRRLEKQVREVVRGEILKVINGKQDAISPASIINSIGLTNRQASTVERARQRLLKEGKLSGKALEKDLDRLRVKLLRERAELIAEHETRMAHALGQQAAWEKLFDEGKLKGGRRHWHKLWIASTDERTCPTCMDLDGREVPIKDLFIDAYFAPPEPHPRCRCSIALVETVPGWKREPFRLTDEEMEQLAGGSLGGGHWVTIKGRKVLLDGPGVGAGGGGGAGGTEPGPTLASLGDGSALDPQNLGWEKLSDKPLGGHSAASIYRDKEGNLWYVKKADSAAHASNEVIAGKLYALAGIPHVETQLATVGGQSYIASKMVAHAGTPNSDDIGVRRGFATDAWLANWDVAGTKGENIVLSQQIGKIDIATRIEAGGALLYRGMGEAKGAKFTPTVGELDSLRNPNKNATSAYLFRNITPGDIAKGIENHVGKVTDAEIRHAVNTFGGGLSEPQRTSLISTLIQRRNAMQSTVKDYVKAEETRLANVAASKTPSPPTGKIYNLSASVPKGSSTPHPSEPKPASLTTKAQKCLYDDHGAPSWTLDNWGSAGHPRPDANGTPTNPQSGLYKQAAQRASYLVSGWKSLGQEERGFRLRKACIEELGAVGMQSKSASTDVKIDVIDRYAAKVMYRATQMDMARAGITDQDRFHLFRGVTKKYTANMAAEGYSTSKTTAQNFDNYGVYSRAVKPSSIMTAPFGQINYGSHSTEKEYIVLSGPHYEGGVFGQQFQPPAGAGLKAGPSAPAGWGAKPLNLTDLAKQFKVGSGATPPTKSVVPKSTVTPPASTTGVAKPAAGGVDAWLANYKGKKYTQFEMKQLVATIQSGADPGKAAYALGINENTGWMVAYNHKLGPYAPKGSKPIPAALPTTTTPTPHPWLSSPPSQAAAPISISNTYDYQAISGKTFKKDTWVYLNPFSQAELEKAVGTPIKQKGPGLFVKVPAGHPAPPGAKSHPWSQKQIAQSSYVHIKDDYFTLMGKPPKPPAPPATVAPSGPRVYHDLPQIKSAAGVSVGPKPGVSVGWKLYANDVWVWDPNGSDYVKVKAGRPVPAGCVTSSVSQDALENAHKAKVASAPKSSASTVVGLNPPTGFSGRQAAAIKGWLANYKGKKYTNVQMVSAVNMMMAFSNVPAKKGKSAFYAQLAKESGISESTLWYIASEYGL